MKNSLQQCRVKRGGGWYETVLITAKVSLQPHLIAIAYLVSQGIVYYKFVVQNLTLNLDKCSFQLDWIKVTIYEKHP